MANDDVIHADVAMLHVSQASQLQVVPNGGASSDCDDDVNGRNNKGLVTKSAEEIAMAAMARSVSSSSTPLRPRPGPAETGFLTPTKSVPEHLMNLK